MLRDVTGRFASSASSPRSLAVPRHAAAMRLQELLTRRLEEYFNHSRSAKAAIARAVRIAEAQFGRVPTGERDLRKFGELAARIYNNTLHPKIPKPEQGAVLSPRFFREFYVARDLDPAKMDSAARNAIPAQQAARIGGFGDAQFRICPVCKEPAPALPYRRLGKHGPWLGRAVCPASGDTLDMAFRLWDEMTNLIVTAQFTANGRPRSQRIAREESTA